MSTNRQQRRHPTHPAVPLPQPSGERISVKKPDKPNVKGSKKAGKTDAKGSKRDKK